MVQDQPRTSLDILLAPTKYQSTYGVFTVQIPRGPRILKIHQELILPFRVTMDGNDLYWAELQAIKDYRVLGLYLSAKMSCCKSMGPKVL
jgi:hypothetical protein